MVSSAGEGTSRRAEGDRGEGQGKVEKVPAVAAPAVAAPSSLPIVAVADVATYPLMTTHEREVLCAVLATGPRPWVMSQIRGEALQVEDLDGVSEVVLRHEIQSLMRGARVALQVNDSEIAAERRRQINNNIPPVRREPFIELMSQTIDTISQARLFK